MRKFIISVSLSLFLSTLCVANTSIDGEVGETPFSFEKGLVIVEAKIKGKVPVHVVLSTGVEYSITDPGMLDKYDLQSYYSAAGQVLGKPSDPTYSFTTVPGVSVGGSKTKELNMRYGSMAKASQAAGREIFAVLGADFFEGQIVQFDFRKAVLRFLPKSPAAPGKDQKGVLGSGAPIVLKMAEKESNPFMKTFVLPIVDELMINGKELKLLLDTGRATSLAFSSSTAKKVGFTLPAENDPPRADVAAQVDLGGHKMTNVPVILFAKGTVADQSLSKYGVVAGTIFMKDFLVTFDFRNKVVLLERV